MKKSDIKVGEDYAYADYESGRRQRVTVLEVGVSGKNWRGKTITGHKVRYAKTASEGFVEGRNLYTTWAEEQEKRERAALSHRQSLAAWREGREKRAVTALSFNRVLNALGVEDRAVWIPQGRGDDVERIAVHAAELGFHVLVNDRGTVHFLVANDSVVLFFTEGIDVRIPADKVAALVEAAEVFL